MIVASITSLILKLRKKNISKVVVINQEKCQNIQSMKNSSQINIKQKGWLELFNLFFSHKYFLALLFNLENTSVVSHTKMMNIKPKVSMNDHRSK